MEADTPRIEEYLESIYKLQQEQHPVSTSRLAEHLKLSAPSVSEMVKKLAKKDLVKHTEKGVCLTDEGSKIAKKVVRSIASLNGCLPIYSDSSGTKCMKKPAGLNMQ